MEFKKETFVLIVHYRCSLEKLKSIFKEHLYITLVDNIILEKI